MWKRFIVKAIDLALFFLGSPKDLPKDLPEEAATSRAKYPIQPEATSNSDQVNISIVLNAQKIPEDPDDRSWPPKNRMHRRIP